MRYTVEVDGVKVVCEGSVDEIVELLQVLQWDVESYGGTE